MTASSAPCYVLRTYQSGLTSVHALLLHRGNRAAAPNNPFGMVRYFRPIHSHSYSRSESSSLLPLTCTTTTESWSSAWTPTGSAS